MGGTGDAAELQAWNEILVVGNAVENANRRYEAIVKLEHPPAGSRAAEAEPDRLAVMAYHLAATSISTARDHLLTVALLVDGGKMPAFASMSLLRIAHESALVARWFTEPNIIEAERTARGVGGQYADLDERRKFEDAIQRLAPDKGALASVRIEQLMTEAHERGFSKSNKKDDLVPTVPLPKAVPLFDLYESTPQRAGSWLYRYYSGFAHGKQWALVLDMSRQGPINEHGHSTGRLEANHATIANCMALAAAATFTAIDDFVALHTPVHLAMVNG